MTLWTWAGIDKRGNKMGWLIRVAGLGVLLFGCLTGKPDMWFNLGWASIMIGATIVILDFL